MSAGSKTSLEELKVKISEIEKMLGGSAKQENNIDVLNKAQEDNV